jgi:hypothetical protein
METERITPTWSTDPATKVTDAKLIPPWTSDECSGCGRDTARVRTARVKLTGYEIFKLFATAIALMRYAIHPAKTE